MTAVRDDVPLWRKERGRAGRRREEDKDRGEERQSQKRRGCPRLSLHWRPQTLFMFTVGSPQPPDTQGNSSMVRPESRSEMFRFAAAPPPPRPFIMRIQRLSLSRAAVGADAGSWSLQRPKGTFKYRLNDRAADIFLPDML